MVSSMKALRGWHPRRSGADFPGRHQSGLATVVGSVDCADSVELGDRPAARASVSPLGRLIAGRYRPTELLGSGGMGRVWLAHDEVLHRRVALKEDLHDTGSSAGDDRAARLRALEEARAAARVDHNGVVRIYDIARHGDRPWIVMEPLSGWTLAERLKAQGPLPVAEVAAIGLRLLDVLQAVHRAGLVHRDVKPGNVHLCESGRVVLTDFGIASDIDEKPPGDLAGSPSYISPEQLRGDRPEPAGDLFSLGATLYTAVEGRPPFDEGDLAATLNAVLDGVHPALVHGDPLRPIIEGLLDR